MFPMSPPGQQHQQEGVLRWRANRTSDTGKCVGLSVSDSFPLDPTTAGQGQQVSLQSIGLTNYCHSCCFTIFLSLAALSYNTYTMCTGLTTVQCSEHQANGPYTPWLLHWRGGTLNQLHLNSDLSWLATVNALVHDAHNYTLYHTDLTADMVWVQHCGINSVLRLLFLRLVMC